MSCMYDRTGEGAGVGGCALEHACSSSTPGWLDAESRDTKTKPYRKAVLWSCLACFMLKQHPARTGSLPWMRATCVPSARRDSKGLYIGLHTRGQAQKAGQYRV
jgi:hypothetical protein